jgi:hypothetical protein
MAAALSFCPPGDPRIIISIVRLTRIHRRRPTPTAARPTSEDIPTGHNLILSASLDKDRLEADHATGIVSLYHADRKVGETQIKTQLGAFTVAGAGLYVGRHNGEPVTDDYPGQPPYAFTGGTIDRAAVGVSGEPFIDLEREAALMIMRE